MREIEDKTRTFAHATAVACLLAVLLRHAKKTSTQNNDKKTNTKHTKRQKTTGDSLLQNKTDKLLTVLYHITLHHISPKTRPYPLSS